MAEPTSTASSAVAIAAGAAGTAVLQVAPAALPQIVIFGYAVGLRADVLLAGFAGAVVALSFFNTVPSTGDTWRALLETSLRRMWWCLASALSSGYITPLMLLLDGEKLRIPEALVLSTAFVVGGGAQRIVGRFINRAEERAGTVMPATAAVGGDDAAA